MLKQYGFFNLLKLIYFKMRTNFVFKNARIIRFPIDIRGRKFMDIGKGFTTGVGCRLEAYPEGNFKTLFIDENFQMNDYVHITAMQSVSIGRNVLFASKIYISDCSHGSYSGDQYDSSPLENPKDRKMFS